MKVVTAPANRVTAVELTDREIALIARGLYQDNPRDTVMAEENTTLYSQFDELRSDLDIDDIDHA